MTKDGWLEFVSSRLKSQISLENAEKARTWALALLTFFSLGVALNATADGNSGTFVTTKVVFLAFFHLMAFLGFYLPVFLQGQQSPPWKRLGVRDFTSLVAMAMLLSFYSTVIFSLSWQLVANSFTMNVSHFFLVIAWIHFFVSAIYLGASLFFFGTLAFLPHLLSKTIERAGKAFYVFMGIHAGLFLLMAFAYSEVVPLGSLAFFADLRLAGLFWISMAGSLFLAGRLLRDSSVPGLSSLELEIVSGRLERHEDLMACFAEAFVLKRLAAWIGKLTRSLETKTREIFRMTHEALNLVNRERPSELELRQVEERYRRAEQWIRRLEKESARFFVSISFFDLVFAERQKIEDLKDQFSRHLRNARLELGTVRKRIDERLVSLKNSEPPASSPVLVEEVPLTR